MHGLGLKAKKTPPGVDSVPGSPGSRLMFIRAGGEGEGMTYSVIKQKLACPI